MQHLDEGTIHAWLDDALGAEEAATVARHAAECADCAAMVAEARGFVAGASRIVAALDVDRGGIIPKPASGPATSPASPSLWRSLRLTPARAAIAATLLVAVGSVFTIRERNQIGDRVTPAAANRAMDSLSVPAAAKTVPAAAPAPAQTQEINGRPRGELKTRAAALAQVRADSGGAGAGGIGNAVGGFTEARSNPSAVAGQRVDSTPRVAVREAAAPSAPASAPAAASPTSANQATAKQLQGANAFAASARDTTNQPKLSDAVVTSVSAAREAARRREAPATGRSVCYAFTNGVPAWAAGIPTRFALDDMPTADSTDSRLVVRRVTPEGKVDGPIAGSWWRRLGVGAGTAMVTWTRSDTRDTVGLSLIRGEVPSLLKATMRDSARVEPVVVSALGCSP